MVVSRLKCGGNSPSLMPRRTSPRLKNFVFFTVLHLGQGLSQQRQVTVDDLPDNLKVNAEIVVDDSISQADDFMPFYLRMFFLEIIGQPIRGLANNLEVSDDGIDGFLVV
jgi:hypothetical protein